MNTRTSSPKRQSRERAMLSQIGISFFHPQRFRGYLGLYSFDTFIEEMGSNGSITTVSPYSENTDAASNNKKNNYLQIEVVSKDKTKRDLEELIAKDFNISKKDIYFPDEKKAKSIFAQKIILSHIHASDLLKKETKGYFIKNPQTINESQRRKRPLGDMYTVFVRTDEPIDEDTFLTHVARIESRGFLNFYHYTRFDKRLIAHIVGAEILKGHYEEAVKKLLLLDTQFEYRKTAEIRREAQSVYPDLKKIKSLFEKERNLFKKEIKVLDTLIENENNYLKALTSISGFVHTCLRGFSAHIFNRYVSDMAHEEKRMKPEIPLFPAHKNDNDYFYAKYLEEFDIPKNFAVHIKPFSQTFKSVQKIYRPTRINSHIKNITIIPDGVIMSFSLPRETHVRILLNNIFILMAHGRIPNWVSQEKYDILQTLGRESVQSILQKIKKS
jgi:tRNA(Glu) U13 pseudouridine synthase TruD